MLESFNIEKNLTWKSAEEKIESELIFFISIYTMFNMLTLTLFQPQKKRLIKRCFHSGYPIKVATDFEMMTFGLCTNYLFTSTKNRC